MAAGLLVLLFAVFLPRPAQVAICAVALLASLMLPVIAVDLPPARAPMTLFNWRYGHLLNFNGLTQSVLLAWPLFASGWLFVLSGRPGWGEPHPLRGGPGRGTAVEQPQQAGVVGGRLGEDRRHTVQPLEQLGAGGRRDRRVGLDPRPLLADQQGDDLELRPFGRPDLPSMDFASTSRTRRARIGMIGAGSSPERCRLPWWPADPFGLPFPAPFVVLRAPFDVDVPFDAVCVEGADARRGDRRRSVLGILLQL